MVETAHPRACGENFAAATGDLIERGSSPRVRGKPCLVELELRDRGLIPARAGKTCDVSAGGMGIPAHPRACGENLLALLLDASSAGSSPRVRGKPRQTHPHPGGPRLIPARAGKTTISPSPRTPSWAHPRACGENPSGSAKASATSGSSPRVRGKPRRDGGDQPPPGLIPARAGKTITIGAPLTLIWGSSPRVRGKPTAGILSRTTGGLIPARAGKTTGWGRLGPGATAHPRACGENRVRLMVRMGAEGSSPRVRGKLRLFEVIGGRRGLIPARAGKTQVGAEA